MLKRYIIFQGLEIKSDDAFTIFQSAILVYFYQRST